MGEEGFSVPREEREQQIKQLWWKGLSFSQIARRLVPPMSRNTVVVYIARMKRRGEIPAGGRGMSWVDKFMEGRGGG